MTVTIPLQSITLEVMQCDSCGIYYGVPEGFDQLRLKQGGKWFCPNGHSWEYTTNEVDRLKGELAKAAKNLEYQESEARRQRERAQSLERSNIATRGAMTRLKNRAACGVCIHCNRTFQNLARHMQSKHKGLLHENDGQ